VFFNPCNIIKQLWKSKRKYTTW